MPRFSCGKPIGWIYLEAVGLCDKPGASHFVSGRKYFISRVELNETGGITCYMTLQSLNSQSWEVFPDITDHYQTQ